MTPRQRLKKFKGKSGTGLYGDVMMEIDGSVGEVMKALKQNGVADNFPAILKPWPQTSRSCSPPDPRAFPRLPIFT
jgi:hypothetical protein